MSAAISALAVYAVEDGCGPQDSTISWKTASAGPIAPAAIIRPSRPTAASTGSVVATRCAALR